MKIVKSGFTLIELLVVVVILGILAAVGLGQFYTAQKRGRDAQRKENLSSITKALEMYYNDYEQYPGSALLVWGDEFTDGKTVYMKQLPKDPADNFQYFYETDADGSFYRLYALLEHSEDIDRGGPYAASPDDCHTEVGDQDCNYCIASSNEECE